MEANPADYPQMWQKPAYEELLACLESLKILAPVWNPKQRQSDILQAQEASSLYRREISIYLSSIIKSGLGWIEDDDQKEMLWTEASRRMSERCGRTAMGEITRRWPFEAEDSSPFELVIREPPITGDNLGFKTWSSSYVLALHLPRLANTSLFRLFDESLGHSKPRILELGSGTGLLGLAAAAFWQVHVTLTDLPEIVPNLTANADDNRELLESRGASANTGILTWGGSEDEVDQELFGTKNQFKVSVIDYLLPPPPVFAAAKYEPGL
jgi:hypothetical protein